MFSRHFSKGLFRVRYYTDQDWHSMWDTPLKKKLQPQVMLIFIGSATERPPSLAQISWCILICCGCVPFYVKILLRGLLPEKSIEEALIKHKSQTQSLSGQLPLNKGMHVMHTWDRCSVCAHLDLCWVSSPACF